MPTKRRRKAPFVNKTAPDETWVSFFSSIRPEQSLAWDSMYAVWQMEAFTFTYWSHGNLRKEAGFYYYYSKFFHSGISRALFHTLPCIVFMCITSNLGYSTKKIMFKHGLGVVGPVPIFVPGFLNSRDRRRIWQKRQHTGCSGKTGALTRWLQNVLFPPLFLWTPKLQAAKFVRGHTCLISGTLSPPTFKQNLSSFSRVYIDIVSDLPTSARKAEYLYGFILPLLALRKLVTMLSAQEKKFPTKPWL